MSFKIDYRKSANPVNFAHSSINLRSLHKVNNYQNVVKPLSSKETIHRLASSKFAQQSCNSKYKMVCHTRQASSLKNVVIPSNLRSQKKPGPFATPFKLDRTVEKKSSSSRSIRSRYKLISSALLKKKSIASSVGQQFYLPLYTSTALNNRKALSLKRKRINTSSSTTPSSLRLLSRFKLLRRHSIVRHSSVKLRNQKCVPSKSTSSIFQRNLYQMSIERAKYCLRRKNKLCLFYLRFGTCKRGQKCLYLHDFRKVAICKKFLKGVCEQGSSCLLSHEFDRDRLPACEFFLRGKCSHEAGTCPFPHVHYSKGAALCMEFQQGFCAAGQHCTKRHEWRLHANSVNLKRRVNQKLNFFTSPTAQNIRANCADDCDKLQHDQCSTSNDSAPFFIPLPSLKDEDWALLSDDLF